MYQVGWFSTGRDEAASTLFKAVMERIRDGYIPDTEVSYVFSNREAGENPLTDRFLQMVDRQGVRIITFPHRRFKPELRMRGVKESERLGCDSPEIRRWRIEYDREVMRLLEPYEVDLRILAGYMLILGGEMCRLHRFLNLHPSPPGGPRGTWQEVVWQLIEHRARWGGAMMHIVTEELDRGPPVTYCTFPLTGPLFNDLWREVETRRSARSFDRIVEVEGESNRLFKRIREEEARRETPLLVETVKGFAVGRFAVEDYELVVEGSRVRGGVCLNEEVKEYVRRFD